VAIPYLKMLQEFFYCGTSEKSRSLFAKSAHFDRLTVLVKSAYRKFWTFNWSRRIC